MTHSVKHPMAFVLFLLFASLMGGCGDGSSNGDPQYVALGASDAVGIGATPITNGYVYLVEDGLEQETGESFELYNLGIPGAEVSDIKNIEERILEQLSPNVITLSTGANDIIAGNAVADFEADLSSLLSRLRATAPTGVIAVANVPNLVELPRFRDNPDRDVTTARIRSFNQAIARQAAAYQAVLVDLYTVNLNDSLVNPIDGFHPSDAGHRAIADRFLAALKPYIPAL